METWNVKRKKGSGTGKNCKRETLIRVAVLTETKEKLEDSNDLN